MSAIYRIRNVQKDHSNHTNPNKTSHSAGTTRFTDTRLPVRKIKKTTPRPRSSVSTETTDKNFNILHKNSSLTKKEGELKHYNEEQKETEIYQPSRKIVARQLKQRNTIKTISKKDRQRAAKINLWVLSFGFCFWLFWQFPFAILNAIFFGLMAAVSSLGEEYSKVTNESWWGKTLDVAINTIKGILGGLNSLVEWLAGIDVGGLLSHLINPATYFMLTLMVIVTFNILQMLLFYFIYKINRLEPVFGKGSGIKVGAILLILIGSVIPVLNMFPWFIFWTIAIWKNPK